MEQHEIKKHLKKQLDKDRYEHTKGVMYTAACLAMAHGQNIEQAMLAGLLHDCAKCTPWEEQEKLCKENAITITPVEYKNHSLLHAKTGSILAEKKYGVKDPEILHAIRVHTTGEPDMSMLDKILYIADYIEPGRNKAPNLTEVRKLAFADLNSCMAKILGDMLEYLSVQNGSIDPMTQLTYEYYKQYQNIAK
jgi:predicted HD superfamily hydrolase involved in NAD metabolism